MPVSVSSFDSPGSPAFLLRFLLASSWTWLALSLATIATLLRAIPAFSLTFFRFRRSSHICSLEPSSTSLPSSSHSPLSNSSGCIRSQIDRSSSRSIERQPTSPKLLLPPGFTSACRRKNRSKSSSALQKLLLQHHKHNRVLRSKMGLFSSLLDSDTDFTLEKFPNSNSSLKTFSDVFNLEFDSAGAKALGGRGCKFSFELQKEGRNAVDRVQEGEGGPICDGVKGFSSESFSEGELPHIEQYRRRYDELPSWAFSFFESVESVVSSAIGSSNMCYNERVSSFETQCGLDTKLFSRTGSSWQCPGQTLRGSAEPQQYRQSHEVVKVWSSQQKTLLKKLKIVESTTTAFELGWRNKSACVGAKTGEISLWDFGTETIVSRVFPIQKPVTALFTDPTNSMTMVGTKAGADMVYGLWDHRSCYVPFFQCEGDVNIQFPTASVKLKGHDLCVAGSDGLSIHDLRKPSSNPNVWFPIGVAGEFSSHTRATEEDPTILWEFGPSLASDEDDDYCDDCFETGNPRPDLFRPNGSSSFMSRCVGLIRSLSSQSAPTDNHSSAVVNS